MFAGEMQAAVRQDHLVRERRNLSGREHRAAAALQWLAFPGVIAKDFDLAA